MNPVYVRMMLLGALCGAIFAALVNLWQYLVGFKLHQS